MDAIWRKLPEDLQEKVLPFVPVPSLCRFRQVCKRWAGLITQPAFAAKAKSKATYLLMSPARVKPAKLRDNWEICDTATHNHFTLSQDFLHLLPAVRDRFTVRYGRYARSTIAADSGFICVLWQRLGGHDEAIFVVNPITTSCQELPCFARTSTRFSFGQNNPCVAMMVADDVLSFQLFVLQEASLPSGPEKHRCSVFDSRVGEWREISQPCSKSLKPCHMLRIGKTLYTILLDEDLQTPGRFRTPTYEVHAYDTDLDVWIHTQVRARRRQHDRTIMIPQLVACSGRLFFTAWEDQKQILIWEIDLAERTCTFVARTAVEDPDCDYRLVPHYENPFGSKLNPYVDYLGSTGANVLAFGSDDGRILISSVTRRCLAYVVSTGSWFRHAAPFCWKSFMDIGSFEAKRVGLFGSVMTLTLCPVPSVTKPATVVV